MCHVDALSRNPVDSVDILQIEADDWVLAGQLFDQDLQAIHSILSKPPGTTYDHHIYKNYALPITASIVPLLRAFYEWSRKGCATR